MSTANETHHITLQIKALGNGPQHHIDLAVTAGALRDVVESSKPFPSEFYQSGGKVGKTNIPAGRDYQSIPDVKPTFTQAMADAGELPPYTTFTTLGRREAR